MPFYVTFATNNSVYLEFCLPIQHNHLITNIHFTVPSGMKSNGDAPSIPQAPSLTSFTTQLQAAFALFRLGDGLQELGVLADSHVGGEVAHVECDELDVLLLHQQGNVGLQHIHRDLLLRDTDSKTKRQSASERATERERARETERKSQSE